MSLSYEQSGVRYDQLDAFKRACQRAARTTTGLLASHGYSEPAATRGESAYLIEAPDHYLAQVEEGLGTKNLVADAVQAATGRTWYREVAIDTVATIVNDLVTCGALPVSVAMHAAVGDSGWFADRARAEALVEGFAEGCRLAGAVWGGGETPTLGGIVEPGAIVLAGSAVGRISPKHLRITGDVREGDSIIFLLGRRFGAKLLAWQGTHHLFPPEKQAKVQALFEKHGATVLLIARFLPGLRAPIFSTAGAMRVSYLKFALHDGLAAVLSVPLFVWFGHWLWAKFDEDFQKLNAAMSKTHWFGLAVIGLILLGAFGVWRWRARYRARNEA